MLHNLRQVIILGILCFSLVQCGVFRRGDAGYREQAKTIKEALQARYGDYLKHADVWVSDQHNMGMKFDKVLFRVSQIDSNVSSVSEENVANILLKFLHDNSSLFGTADQDFEFLGTHVYSIPEQPAKKKYACVFNQIVRGICIDSLEPASWLPVEHAGSITIELSDSTITGVWSNALRRIDIDLKPSISKEEAFENLKIKALANDEDTTWSSFFFQGVLTDSISDSEKIESGRLIISTDIMHKGPLLLLWKFVIRFEDYEYRYYIDAHSGKAPWYVGPRNLKHVS